MSQEAGRDGGKKPPVAVKAGSGATKLSALSSSQRLPKWSFSKAERFAYNRKSTKKDMMESQGMRFSRSSPALTVASTCATEREMASTQLPGSDELSEAGGNELLGDLTSPGDSTWLDLTQTQDSRMTMTGTRDLFRTTGMGSTTGFGGEYDVSSPSLLNSNKAPRLDGSLDRFLEPPERAAEPRPKAYDPAETMGSSTAVSFHHAPRFSFGGGKSRMDGLRSKDKLARMAASSGFVSTHTPENDAKNEALIQKLEMESARNTASLTQKTAKKLSRGFGTAPRLRYRGGALELPPSPGPAAYDIMRDGDALPDWVSSKILPWGVRSAKRPTIKNVTASDVAPGEHTANHPFQAAGPSPIFGHPLRELTKDNFPEPSRYNIPTSIGTAVSAPIGPGPRTKWGAESSAPGPGRYEPKYTVTDSEPTHATFGNSERGHEVDLVDPDEPPGPGTHDVRGTMKARRSVGLPKGEKLKKVPGLGPEGPAPGHYQPKNLSKGPSARIGLPLDRGIEGMPGPGTYEPDDHLAWTSPPSWGPLHYTNPRKSPFGEVSAGSNTAAEAMTRRAAAAAAEESELLGYNKIQKAKEEEFVVTGPRWSLGARRPLGGKASSHDCEAMLGTVSSFG